MEVSVNAQEQFQEQQSQLLKVVSTTESTNTAHDAKTAPANKGIIEHY